MKKDNNDILETGTKELIEMGDEREDSQYLEGLTILSRILARNITEKPEKGLSDDYEDKEKLDEAIGS